MNRIVLISAIIISFALTSCIKTTYSVSYKLGRGSSSTITLNGRTDQMKVTDEGHVFLNSQKVGECGVGQRVEFKFIEGKFELVKTATSK
ncbi:MAG: hypothetical protein COA79_23240 [Planctomycetota bacterium]|nr:MAG: hypothetical protein COA79_23240 [Planctomycetota bacterium]